MGRGVWDIQILSELQNGCPAIIARCSDHKWTSHNKGAYQRGGRAAKNRAQTEMKQLMHWGAKWRNTANSGHFRAYTKIGRKAWQLVLRTF